MDSGRQKMDTGRQVGLWNTPKWCKSAGRKMKSRNQSVASCRKVRASISLPPELYHGVEEIARTKKVSIAWVVRNAVEKYLESEKPVSRK